MQRAFQRRLPGGLHLAPGRDLLALGIEGPSKPLLRGPHSDHSLGKRYRVTCSVTPSVTPLQTDSLPTVGERLSNPLAFELRKSDFKSSFGRGDAQICAPSFRWSARGPHFGRLGTWASLLAGGRSLRSPRFGGWAHFSALLPLLWTRCKAFDCLKKESKKSANQRNQNAPQTRMDARFQGV